MTRVPVAEDDLVARLRTIFGPAPVGVGLGIGDDCAVLDARGEELVWTIDAQVDEVHFQRAWLTYAELGYRSFAAAASDVVAMGGSPFAALSALTFDASVTEHDLMRLAAGQAEAAREAGAAVVGGNLSRGGALTVTTTLVGRAARPVTRGGARPGERIWVGGPLGLARLGLLAHLQGREGDPALAEVVSAFRRPRVRYDLAGCLQRAASAAIDVSDGLSLDVARLAASSDVRAVLDAAAVVASGGEALRSCARALGEDPLACALRGGEDYVIVACAAEPLEGFLAIGRVEVGEGVLLESEGRASELTPQGHDHLARSRA